MPMVRKPIDTAAMMGSRMTATGVAAGLNNMVADMGCILSQAASRHRCRVALSRAGSDRCCMRESGRVVAGRFVELAGAMQDAGPVNPFGPVSRRERLDADGDGVLARSGGRHDRFRYCIGRQSLLLPQLSRPEFDNDVRHCPVLLIAAAGGLAMLRTGRRLHAVTDNHRV